MKERDRFRHERTHFTNEKSCGVMSRSCLALLILPANRKRAEMCNMGCQFMFSDSSVTSFPVTAVGAIHVL